MAKLLLLVSLTCILGSATQAGGRDDTASVTINAGAYTIEKTDRGDEIRMDGFGRRPEPGVPMLPARIFAVAVPPGAEVTGVTFQASSEIRLEGQYSIPPVPQAMFIGTGEKQGAAAQSPDAARYDANYRAVYGSDAFFPASAGEFVRPAGYRKYELVDVRVEPFSWNPESGELVFRPSTTVTVSYTLPDEAPEVMQDNLIRTEKVARDIIANYDQAQQWYGKNGPAAGRGLYDFVIVTLDSLTAAVQPIVNGEIAKGRTVNVVTTSWIQSNYTGYDLAEEIRNFLRDKYPSGQWGIEDVLLVGHYDDVMIRRTYQDLGYGKPETDFYFAELSKPDSQSWDDDGDHRWGENGDNIDFYNEVNVGRIPWSDVTNVSSICNKSVAYDNNNDPTFKKNILLLGAFFWPSTDNAVLMERKVNQSWMSDWTMTRMYEQGHSSYSMDYNLTNSNVRSVWGSGKYGFVNWAGHGSPTSAHIYYSGGGSFASTSTCSYLNDDYPSIVFADSCSNGDTDYSNVARAMLRRGAVGFVAATKVALGAGGWSHPNHGSSQSMDYYFTTSVTSCDYTQGQGHQYALREMYTRGLWSYLKYETFEWGCLLGNPNLGMALAGVDAEFSYYNGTSYNPFIFTSTNLPVLGTSWVTQIDGGSQGASGLTFVVAYAAPFGFMTGIGELLIDVSSPWMLTHISGGGSGISTHSILLPTDAALMGVHAYTQGLLNNVGGVAMLTNAIDATLGN